MMKFNEQTQLQKMRGVFAPGPSFKNPNLSPSMTFVDGVHKQVTAKQQVGPYKSMPFKDPWGKHR